MTGLVGRAVGLAVAPLRVLQATGRGVRGLSAAWGQASGVLATTEALVGRATRLLEEAECELGRIHLVVTGVVGESDRAHQVIIEAGTAIEKLGPMTAHAQHAIAEVSAVAGDGGAAVALVASVAAGGGDVVEDLARLGPRADTVITGLAEVSTRGDMVVTALSDTVGRGDRTLTDAAGLLEHAAGLLRLLDAPIGAGAPLLDTVIRRATPQAVANIWPVMEQLNPLLQRLEADLFPALDLLRESAPALPALREIAEHLEPLIFGLQETLSAVPGAGILKRRAAHAQHEDDVPAQQ